MLEFYEIMSCLNKGIMKRGYSVEGIVTITDGTKWGAICPLKQKVIIPCVYDSVFVDMFQYPGPVWIVACREGSFYINCPTQDVHYSGVFDIFDFHGKILFKGLHDYKSHSGIKNFLPVIDPECNDTDTELMGG